LNLSWDHFGLHQGKNVKMTMEFEVPKDIFTGLHYPSTWFNGFCDGRGKRVAMVEKNTGPWKKNLLR